MGNFSPLVSVVVPTYNRGHLIARTIDSVLKQTYSNFEIIIVDDASKDNTSEVIASYTDKRIKYIKLKENSKGTKPRNVGILESKGDYIALLDSDDEWLPLKLEKQIEFIKNYNGVNFLCFTNLIFEESNRKLVSKNEKIDESTNIFDYILLNDNCVQTSTYMFPSKLGKKVLFGPNIKKHQDWDFCLRLLKQGTKFIFLPEPLSIYHIDKRGDRIATNSKYKLSLEWGEMAKKDLSERAYFAFLAKYVATPLILNKKRIKAFYLYTRAFSKKSIGLRYFLKGLIKCFIPNVILKKYL